MKTASIHNLLKADDVKVVLVDFFDSIVHRVVHPNYTQRLWSKILIRELGLNNSIDSLYFIRRESSLYLSQKLGVSEIELPYNALKNEVFKRLINTLAIKSDQKDRFLEYFELADLRSELSVQFLNQEIVGLLRTFKSQGLRIYIVSDFYAPVQMFESFLRHHGISDIFDGVFSSSSAGASKQHGGIYDRILDDLGLQGEHLIMIGDNKISDFRAAMKKGLKAYRLPHQKFHFRNRLRSLGNDKKDYHKVIKKTYRSCNIKESPPFSDYIIFFQVYIERLYLISRQLRVKTIFFASREGKFLKRLFDYYQEHTRLKPEDHIQTHYLRMSRQAAFQVTYDKLGKEKFCYLRSRFKTLSPVEFIGNFAFDDNTVRSILDAFSAIDPYRPIEGFFDSDAFEKLITLEKFQQAYEANRKEQKKAFLGYLSSFDTDIQSEGIHIADVGWGGTMQEAIYKVLEAKIPVTGYYLGLRETYDIQEMTKRFGLVFSIQPYEVYSDHILMANTQLYEQLLSADHGSTSGYNSELKNFVIEKYAEEEKELYDNYLKDLQEFMMERFKILLKDLDLICYNYTVVQNKITDLGLRNGLFINSRKLKFINKLNRGFIQNIGTNKIGMEYNRASLGSTKKLIREFLIQPESKFRYLAKLKPVLYNKSKVLAFLLPMRLIYLYFLFNRYVREKILKRRFFLKYNYLR